MRRRARAWSFAFLLSVTASASRAQVSDPSKIGPPFSGQQAELYTPGEGSSAAVVVLHGCDGVGPHYRQWARRLADWGFVALLIDSFRPRGFSEVCNRGTLVPPEIQARDAFDAADWLRAAPNIRAQRVGVIGFSHGGWAVLKAVLSGHVRRPEEVPFNAAVAFYPGCEPRDPLGSRLETDTLILIGDADDWTPIGRCIRWRDAATTNGHTLRMVTYPGARHGFDAPLLPHFFKGHDVGQDPTALADSLVQTQAFFNEHLNPHGH